MTMPEVAPTACESSGSVMLRDASGLLIQFGTVNETELVNESDELKGIEPLRD
jgi:hypothetical protein